MKTPKSLFQLSRKRVLFHSILFCSLFLFSFDGDPNIIQTILKKMQAFHEEHKQEKLYVHFDKPFYAAGENVWLKGYLVEASLHTMDSASRVVYVELVDNTKTILQRKVFYVSKGVMFGDLQLPEGMLQGKYFIRAYTNYMKNVGEDFFFIKEFSVLNPATESDTENNTFDRDSIDLQFFPEGGNLVACGGNNRVAFKAISPDGKSISVEGEILDENNTVVTAFKTAHDGMGMLQLTPASGKKYSARITKPYIVNHLFQLPAVIEKGYCMQVTEIAKNIKVVSITNAEANSFGQLTGSLVVQSRGKVYHAQLAVFTNKSFFTYIPRSKLPEGVSQITLFDPEGIPVAERLIYQNQNESVEVAVKTDNLIYGKRSLVTVETEALYRNGAAAEGDFSMSVYDEGLLISPEKYPLTIHNYLSLTSDLKGYIENPGYYFKDSLPETKKHIDLLMMVHGWRRFTWKEVLDENQRPQKYNREQGIPISGRIQKAYGKNTSIEKGNVKILTMTGEGAIVKTDSLGKFYSDHFLFYDSMDLVFQTENEKGKKRDYKFLLDPFNPSPLPEYSVTAFTPFNAERYLAQQYEQKAIDQSKLTSETKQLKEIEISAKRIEDKPDRGKVISVATNTIDVSKTGDTYQNIFQMLQSRVAGVTVSGNPPNMSVTIRGQTPVFLLDGSVSTIEIMNMISPSMVKTIEVVKGPGAAVYGGTGVINLVLKDGAWDRVTVGMNQVKYRGFNVAREFYSPRYEVADDRHNLPDKRTTLYWNPFVKTNANGKAVVSFYTADVSSNYRIIIEGITPDGYPGTSTATFVVK